MTRSKPAPPPPRTEDTWFITGYPGFLARHVMQAIVTAVPKARVVLLVQPKFAKEAAASAAQWVGDRATVVSGDVVDMHLGLAGPEYTQLCESVTHIMHVAAISYLGMARETARKVNVDGTRTVLEFARDCQRLQRFVHFSTAYVSGDRVGVIADDELDRGQGFRNVYEETKFEAEKLVQLAMPRLPITIVRPSTVVGNSRTGEIDRLEGPYQLALMLILSPEGTPLPLPGDGAAPLNVVPVDYVADAAVALARTPEALGKTLHLVDPNPMSARRVYEQIATRTHRSLPRYSLPARAADLLLRIPLLEKFARPQRAAINYVNHLALYSAHHTLTLLEGTGIRCPPLSSYLDTLVDFAVGLYKRNRSQGSIEDALDFGQPD